ncbi:hypothetical protein [Bradyrhizobium sp. Ai1a-2]|nr:hypothetical protein [Bradyrhizobium sp. Ai1a-2]
MRETMLLATATMLAMAGLAATRIEHWALAKLFARRKAGRTAEAGK